MLVWLLGIESSQLLLYDRSIVASMTIDLTVGSFKRAWNQKVVHSSVTHEH